jgi:hypothetical protein
MAIYTHILGNDEAGAMDELGATICGSPRRKPAASESQVPMKLCPDVSGIMASN